MKRGEVVELGKEKNKGSSTEGRKQAKNNQAKEDENEQHQDVEEEQQAQQGGAGEKRGE